MDEKDNSNFQGLVSGISDHERKTLLSNITKNSNEEVASIGVPVGNEAEEAPSVVLLKKFKEMSIFQRIWFRIKSIFTNVPLENVINSYFVSRIGSVIENEYTGIINCRKQILLEGFYDRLKQLKLCADFFAPFMYDIDSNPDAFYVLLGTVVMPEIATQIETESDPYQYPFTKELNNEMRASLLHKMESIQDNIPVGNKTIMYASVRAVEWLRQFVKLPFDRFLAKFTGETGAHQCAFSQITNETAAFAKVFDDMRPVTEEILQAIHLRIQARAMDYQEGAADNFLSSAQNQISVVSMFSSSIPMAQIAKVVFFNSMYTPETFSGGEDWLIRYKSQQKVIFDRKWARWLHDYKKNQTKSKLQSYFALAALPQFPSRPWEKLWGTGIKFKYALTSGFLYYFFKTIYPEYSQLFKIVSLEGDFSIKDNRLEFTDTINEYNHICDEVDIIANQMSKGGEYGQSLYKYCIPGVRSKNAEERVGVLISEMEKNCQAVLNDFGKACRSMESILLALDGEKITAYYGPLTNLAHIQGNANKEFREKLYKVRSGISHAYEVIMEMEALDREDCQFPVE